MNFFLSTFGKLPKLGAFFSALALGGLVVLIITEIFLRYFFDMSTLIADEYSGYLYLVSIFLGLGYTFERNEHIRINLLTSKFSKKSNQVIDKIATVLILGLLMFILYRSVLFVYDSYDLEMLSEAVSETPLYLVQIFIPIGVVIFLFAGFKVLLKGFDND